MSASRPVVSSKVLLHGITLAVGEVEKWADPKIKGHLKDTPRRIAEAWEEFFGGIDIDPSEYVRSALQPTVGDQMITIRNIPFVSICAHHFVSFIGKVHVGYIPKKKIIGLSKIPRIVEAFARRPQVQENLTENIAQCLYEGELGPRGVGVVVQAVHHCMLLRGVKKYGETVTSALRGNFMESSTKQEFFQWLKIRP